MSDDDIRPRSRRIGQRRHRGYVAELGAQLLDVAEVERAQRAGLDADGHLALGHAVLASVAFHAVSRTTIETRRPIGTRKGAVPASDAASNVNGHQSRIGILMHCARRADMRADGIAAMAAGIGYVIREAVGMPGAGIVLTPRAAAILVHLAKRHAAGQVVIILACEHARLAARAARAVEVESVLHASPFCRKDSTTLTKKLPVGRGRPGASMPLSP